MASTSNVSSDLLWEICRNNNSYLVQRTPGKGPRFSRDPLNLTNIHSRKFAGFVADKALGIHNGSDGSLVVSRKITKNANKPGQSSAKTSLRKSRSSRDVYKSVANQSAQSHYRPDLRQAAVSRAAAYRKAATPVKAAPESKKRGARK